MKLTPRFASIALLPLLAVVCVFAADKKPGKAQTVAEPKSTSSLELAPIQIKFGGTDDAVKIGVNCKELRDALKKYTRDNATWTQMKFDDSTVLEPGASDGVETCRQAGPDAGHVNTHTAGRPSISQSAGFQSTADLTEFLRVIGAK